MGLIEGENRRGKRIGEESDSVERCI